MSEAKTPAGQIRSEVHGRVFKIIIDNAAKKNAFSPEMMAQMSDALTTLHNNDEYWVGRGMCRGHGFHGRARHAEVLRSEGREVRVSRKAISTSSGSQTGAASRSLRRSRASCSPSASK